MKRATLVHNPTAGEGRHSAAELGALLKRAGFRVSHVHAKKKRQLKKLRDARGLIVVAGGDGTVHKVGRLVAGLDKTIAILPLGTANNIARSLGVEGEPREIVSGLSRARKLTIDVGIAEGPWGRRVFMEGAGGGLFAEVMARLESNHARQRKRSSNPVTRFSRNGGSLEPALHALAEALPDFKAKAFAVTIDGKRISGSFLLLEAMSMPYLGPNLQLGPDADPSDGLLDFVLLSEGQRKEFEGYIHHRLDGGRDAPVLTVLKGKRLHCVWRGTKLHIDDKIALTGKGKSGKAPPEIDIHVEPRSLRFLIPRIKGGGHRAKPGAGRPVRAVRRQRRRFARIRHE